MIQKFILPILILITVFSCKEKEQKTALAPQIKVVEVFKQDVPIYNYFVGEVFGEEDVSINARVEGFLTGIHFIHFCAPSCPNACGLLQAVEALSCRPLHVSTPSRLHNEALSAGQT